MLKRLIAAAALLVVLGLSAAFGLLGCDVGGPPVRVEQDVEVHVPGNPPGEADEENPAQNK